MVSATRSRPLRVEEAARRVPQPGASAGCPRDHRGRSRWHPAWRALPGAEQVVKDGLAEGDRGVLVGHPTYMAFTDPAVAGGQGWRVLDGSTAPAWRCRSGDGSSAFGKAGSGRPLGSEVGASGPRMRACDHWWLELNLSSMSGIQKQLQRLQAVPVPHTAPVSDCCSQAHE